MTPPRLNRRLVLEAVTRVPDGAGGFAEAWVGRGAVWAEMVPGGGREVVEGGADLARVPWRITLRAAPEGSPQRPRPGERLREGARVFAVLAVAERDPEGRYLTLAAREEGPA
jgi:head-tail adaptor